MKILFFLCASTAYAQALAGIVGQVSHLSGATCQSGYAHCAQLTVGTVTGTLTDFPVLVDVTLGASKINNANCYDVAFSTTQAGTTPLFWELDAGCNSTTGRVVAWVKNTIATGTTFWIQYGGAQSTFQSTATSTWNSNFNMVLHVPDGTTLAGPSLDSTTNARSATPFHMVVAAGQIDGGASTNGDAAATMYRAASGTLTQNIGSVSMWVKPASASAGLTGYFMDIDAIRYAIYMNGGTASFYFDGRSQDITGVSWTANTWHQFAFLYNKTGNVLRWFIDGAEAGQGAGSGTWGSTAMGVNVMFANKNSQDALLGGIYDEIRTSSVILSDGWIAAEYANQSAPGTFLTKGSEQ